MICKRWAWNIRPNRQAVLWLVLWLALGNWSAAFGLGEAPALPDLPPVTWDRMLPAVRDVIKEAYDAVLAHPHDAAANGKLGMALHAHNLLPEAELCYRRAGLLDATAFHWTYFLGLVQMDQAKCNEALPSFAQALRLRPDYLPAQLRSGECLLASSKWEQAATFYQTLVQSHPESSEANYGLGRVRAVRNQWTEAVESFRKACQLHPKFAAAHFALARAYQHLGKADQAKEELRLSRESEGEVPEIEDPLLAEVQAMYRDYSAYLKLATELGGAGKLDDAAAAYEEALQINPRLPEAETRLIYIYGRLGQLAKAEQHYRTAVGLDPKRWDAYFEYGTLLQGQGKNAEAEAAFRKAVEINPRYAEAHNNLGYLLEGQGKLPEAVGELKKAIENSPGFPQAHFSLGRILVKEGDYQQGIPHLLQALATEDGSIKASYFYAVGLAFAAVGDLENGVRYLRAALLKARDWQDAKLTASIEDDLRLLTGQESAP